MSFKVEGRFYANDKLINLIFEELKLSLHSTGTGFLPAVKQIGNVASLPGIVKVFLFKKILNTKNSTIIFNNFFG